MKTLRGQLTHTTCESKLQDNIYYEPVLQANNLSKAFNAKYAIKDISFHLNKGEILGILGPNGAGKTTTLHLLLGLIKATSGEVNIFGLNLDKNRSEILSRMNFSSSYISMPYNLSVMDNLIVFARLYQIKKLREKISSLLNLFEIENLKDKITGSLSSGQNSRVNLVKALLNEPEILLLDEPTASLDPDIALKVRTILCDIREKNRTSIIYTSHNMEEVENMCDRLIFLANGTVLIQGTTAEILEKTGKSNLEELFISVSREQRQHNINDINEE